MRVATSAEHAVQNLSFPQSSVWNSPRRMCGNHGLGSSVITTIGRSPRCRAHRRNAECRDIHDDHNEREEIQAHHQSNGSVHCQDTNKPNKASLFDPNENWVADLEQADRNAENRQNVFESDENIRRHNSKRRPDQRAPKVGTVPPPVTKTFCQAADKLNEEQMHL